MSLRIVPPGTENKPSAALTPPPSKYKRPTRVDHDLKCPFNSFKDCYQDNCACWDTYRLMCSRK